MIVTMADNNAAAVSTATNNTINHQPACRGKQFSIMVDNEKKKAAMKKKKSTQKMALATVIYYYPWKSKDNNLVAVPKGNKSVNEKHKNN
jgi:hypothetical protein